MCPTNESPEPSTARLARKSPRVQELRQLEVPGFYKDSRLGPSLDRSRVGQAAGQLLAAFRQYTAPVQMEGSSHQARTALQSNLRQALCNARPAQQETHDKSGHRLLLLQMEGDWVQHRDRRSRLLAAPFLQECRQADFSGVLLRGRGHDQRCEAAAFDCLVANDAKPGAIGCIQAWDGRSWSRAGHIGAMQQLRLLAKHCNANI